MSPSQRARSAASNIEGVMNRSPMMAIFTRRRASALMSRSPRRGKISRLIERSHVCFGEAARTFANTRTQAFDLMTKAVRDALRVGFEYGEPHPFHMSTTDGPSNAYETVLTHKRVYGVRLKGDP